MSEPWIIHLSKEELQFAGFGGVMRCIERNIAGSQPLYGQSGNAAWGDHVLGSIGELITSKLMNVYWTPAPGKPDRGDVARMLQVRFSNRPDASLIIHERDDNKLIGLLIVPHKWHKDGLDARVAGWLPVKECKNKEWWGDFAVKNRPAYFVPQQQLRDPSTIWKALGLGEGPDA